MLWSLLLLAPGRVVAAALGASVIAGVRYRPAPGEGSAKVDA